MSAIILAAAMTCWINPSFNQDGTPLADLVSVSVHSGTQPRTYTERLDVPTSTPGARLCRSLDAPPGTLYVAVTALNARTERSAFSNEAIFTVAPPEPPEPVAPPVLLNAEQALAATESGTLLIGVTGTPVTLHFDAPGNWEVQLLRYGATVPLLTGRVRGTQWTFNPPRAGLFFSRVRAVGARDWVRSDAGETGFLYVFRLAAPSGGGIE